MYHYSLQRNKKVILDSCNGYDYYDGEFIKEKINLNKNDRLYPHFDHKIYLYNQTMDKWIKEGDECV